MDIHAWVSMLGYPWTDIRGGMSLDKDPSMDVHAWIFMLAYTSINEDYNTELSVKRSVTRSGLIG